VSTREERTIEIAGIGFRFIGDAAAMEIVDRRYGAFRTASVADATVVDIEILPLTTSVPWLLDDTIAVVSDEKEIVLEGAGVRARIATDLRQARFSVPRADRAVDALMRFLLGARLLRAGAALVHASAVVLDGQAWVFPGPSGIGKTTIGRELEGNLLADEAVALRQTPDGLVAHATPYWAEFPGRALVAGIMFPERGPLPLHRDVSAAQATARLAASIGPILSRDAILALEAAGTLLTVSCASIVLPTIGHIRGWLAPLLSESHTALRLPQPAC